MTDPTDLHWQLLDRAEQIAGGRPKHPAIVQSVLNAFRLALDNECVVVVRFVGYEVQFSFRQPK